MDQYRSLEFILFIENLLNSLKIELFIIIFLFGEFLRFSFGRIVAVQIIFATHVLIFQSAGLLLLCIAILKYRTHKLIVFFAAITN